jgi:UPF0716 protein FxsA
MGWRLRLLVFGYPLAELIAVWLVALWIGWGWTLLLLVLGIPLGLGLMRNAGAAAFREAQQSLMESRAMSPGPAVAFLGGLLVAIPGFLTDLVGLALCIPVTRRIAISIGGGWLAAKAAALRVPGMRTPGDVIQGTVIPPEPAPPGDRPALDG